MNEGFNCCESYKLSDYNSSSKFYKVFFFEISVKLKLNKQRNNIGVGYTNRAQFILKFN